MRDRYRAWRMLAAPKIDIDWDTQEALAEYVGLEPRSARAREMNDAVLELLQDCVDKDHAIRRAPKRSARLGRLTTILKARHAFAKAIKSLDDWTWIELSENLDTAVCNLPPAFWSAVTPEGADTGARHRPLVPIALTEFGRAARALRDRLRATKDPDVRADLYRDEAIARLAEVFAQHLATPVDEEFLRKAVGFVVCALGATTIPGREEPLLTPPEERKIRQRLLRLAKAPQRQPRSEVLHMRETDLYLRMLQRDGYIQKSQARAKKTRKAR